jgi:hypothetical protein
VRWGWVEDGGSGFEGVSDGEGLVRVPVGSRGGEAGGVEEGTSGESVASWPVQRIMEPFLRERIRVERTEGREVRCARRVVGLGGEVVVEVVVVMVRSAWDVPL